MEINCPRCKQPTSFVIDRDCHEEDNCQCEDGIIVHYECDNCNIKIKITMDCKEDYE